MSFTVGTLNAIIGLDDSQFSKGIDKAGKMLGKVDRLAQKTTRTIATGFTATAGATGAVTLKLLNQGIAYNQLQQNSRAALSTILGGAKAANAQMDKLDEFARKSPFAKQVFITAQQQMLGFGIESKKVIPYLDAIQNAVAATGGSSQTLSELSYVIAQISAAGKITATDLMQMGQRGVDAAGMIGEALGKTPAEVREMISKGQLEADRALDLIVAGMTKKYGGATELIKNQMSGAIDRVKGAIRDIGAELAKPFVDPNGGGRAVTWVNRWADMLRAAQGQVRTFSGIILHDLNPAFVTVDKVLARITVATTKWNVNDFVDGLRGMSKYAPAIAGLSGSFAGIALQRVPMLGFINPVVAGFASLVASSPALRKSLMGIVDDAKPLAPLGIQLAKSFGNLLSNAINTVTPLIDSFGGVLVKTGNGLIPLAQGGLDVANALLPLVSVFTDVVNVVGTLPGPLLAGLVALTAWTRFVRTHATSIELVTTGFGKMKDKVKEAGRAYSGFRRDVVNRAALEGVGTGLATATVAAGKFTTGIRSAGLALKGFAIANAPMLALTALVTIITAVAQANAEAKARTDEYTASLDKQTGAVTENTRAWANNEAKNHEEAAKELGVSVEVVTRALLGQGDAIKLLESRYKSVEKESVNGMAGKSKVISANVKALKDMVSETTEARDAAKDAAIGEKALTTELEKQNRIIRENNDLTEKRANAKGALKDAEYASADALARYNEVTANGVDGSMNQERALRALIEARNTEILRLRDSNVEQAQLDERYNSSVSSLREYAKAQMAARGETDLSDAAVNKYLESLGLLPPVKTVTIRLEKTASEEELKSFIEKMKNSEGEVKVQADTNPALVGVAELLGEFDKDHGILTVDANTEEAFLKFLATKGWFDENSGVFTVDADTDEARAEIEKFVQEIRRERTMPLIVDSKGAKDEINVVDFLAKDVKIKPVEANIDAAKQLIGFLNEDIESGKIKPVDADTLKAVAKEQHLTEIIRELATKPVDANTEEGRKRLETLRAEIRKAISVPVTAHEAYGAGSIASSVRSFVPDVISVGVLTNPMRAQKNADGNVLEFFKNGGEHHVAQIAPAGTWRVWAEPETGGEAYIPLAYAKRDRSTSILREVANRFGYFLAPKNAEQFNSGGVFESNAPVTGTTIVYNIGAINNPVAEASSTTLNRELQKIATFGGHLV